MDLRSHPHVSQESFSLGYFEHSLHHLNDNFMMRIASRYKRKVQVKRFGSVWKRVKWHPAGTMIPCRAWNGAGQPEHSTCALQVTGSALTLKDKTILSFSEPKEVPTLEKLLQRTLFCWVNRKWFQACCYLMYPFFSKLSTKHHNIQVRAV